VRTIDAVASIIETAGIAVAGITLFAGSDADLPRISGALITLVESGGGPPVGIHNSRALRQPSIQLTVRGDIYTEITTMLELAYIACGGGEVPLANFSVGDAFFLWMHPAQEPFQLLNDAQGRVRLAFNIDFLRR